MQKSLETTPYVPISCFRRRLGDWYNARLSVISIEFAVECPYSTSVVPKLRQPSSYKRRWRCWVAQPSAELATDRPTAFRWLRMKEGYVLRYYNMSRKYPCVKQQAII